MGRINLILILCITITLVKSQCTDDAAEAYYKRSVYEFSLELTSRLGQETDNHFVASPFSAWTILAAISIGADGETLSELKSVLRLHPHICFTNKYQNVVSNILVPDDTTHLEKASCLFADLKANVKQGYIDAVAKAGVADIVQKPFENTAAAAAMINDYVSRGTAGAITEILSPEELDGIFMVLIDALYFKGTWQTKFDIADTEVSQFYSSSGENQIGDVNLMYLSAKFNTSEIPQIKATVLELPYGMEGKYVMLVFLPYPRIQLSEVIKSLKNINLGSIFRLFKKYGPSKTIVQFPRFKVASDLDNFKELLQDMGLNSMFDERASFPFVSDYSVSVSDLKQKATIEVTEEGTVASAATVADFEFRTLPDQFIANKPFLYMIVDKPTETPIFVGAYSKPTLY